ncbi:hypothetical protein pb186bvf_018134 [Paramecium bursaria]
MKFCFKAMRVNKAQIPKRYEIIPQFFFQSNDKKFIYQVILMIYQLSNISSNFSENSLLF